MFTVAAPTEHAAPEARPRVETLGLPSGWFAIASSAELPRGAILTRPFMSEEIVVYRTQSGEARAVAPHCPHLGAHLGHTGAVEGDTIRCAFHGFCFDRRGTCVKTGYGKRPPAVARLPVRDVRELHGLVLVWHDPTGRPASWEVPELDGTGWSPFVLQRLSLRGHPQDTTENSLDLGHFAVVHGYRDVELLDEPRPEGAHLAARYAMTRPAWPFDGLGLAVRIAFDVHVHGLGYSLVLSRFPALDLHARSLVCATPTEPGRIDLRLGMSIREPRRLGVARGLLARALAEAISVMYRHDVMQDFAIWEHKRYVPRPPLADGDGPLSLYRRWAAQFYAGHPG